MKLIIAVLITALIALAFGQVVEKPLDGAPPRPESPLPDPSQYEWSTCSLSGDPHFRTFDRLRHHYQGVGYYVLVSNPSLHVQAQFRKCGSASCFTRAVIVIGVNKAFIEYQGGASTVRLDTVEKTLTEIANGVILGDGETQVTSSSRGTVVVNNIKKADAPQITIRGSFITISLPKTEEYLSKTEGLCGFFDNDPTNDFLPFGGTNVTFSSVSGGNYRGTDLTTWGNTWSICPTKTADKASCNTDTLFYNKTSGVQPTIQVPPTNPTFPSAALEAAATSYCNKEFGSNQAAHQNCMFDAAILGVVGSTQQPAAVTDAVDAERLIKLWEAIGIGLGITAGIAIVGAAGAFAGSTIFFAHNPEKLPFGKKRKKVGKELNEFGVMEDEDEVQPAV